VAEWQVGTAPPAGYRYVAVKIALSSSSALSLGLGALQVAEDQVGSHYPALDVVGPPPAMKFPVSLKAGGKVAGSVVFQIPYGGLYSLLVTFPNNVGMAKVSLSSIVALATPPPPATPRPTSAPQATPAAKTGGSGGSSSGWTQSDYNTAQAYLASTDKTYAVELPPLLDDLIQLGCDPGTTQEECDARTQQAKSEISQALKDIRTHLGFMSAHPPARCFADAYKADRSLAAKYESWLKNWYPGGWDTSAGRGLQQSLDAVNSQADSFFNHLNGYFSDCG
jgi:hypothetical protein